MPKVRLKYFLTLLSLSLLGVLGNYLNLSLFFGVSFIFGSISVLIAVRLLGTAGAVIVAIIAGSYTYFIWGHPYAMVIFTAEAFIVGILWQRKISSLALADIIFWIVAGIPLVLFFYSGVMGMDQTPTLMIGLKQSVNGVANAIIATYLILLIPSKFILHGNEDAHGKIRLNELLFTTLLGIPLIFSLVMVSFENKLTKENLENGLAEQLEVYLEHVEHDDLLKTLDAIHDDRLRYKRNFEMMVFTEGASFVDSTLPFDKELEFSREGSIKKINEKLSLWMPERKNLPLMIWWKKAYYFVDKSFSGKQKGKVYVLQSTRSVINKIQKDIVTSFELLFSLILIGGVAAYSISRSLTGTIIKLTAATKNLPEKLKNNLKIEWPKSNVAEFLQLSRQAEIMSDNIVTTFDEVNVQAKNILESSVDSIISIDDNSVILGFNHSAENLFGYSKDEVIGENIGVIIPAPYKEKYDGYLSNFKIQKNVTSSEKRIESEGQHKNGSLVPIELFITKTEVNSKTTFTAFISDITERKANEQLKRDFISTVSHELRTPLTSINGSVKLIQAQQGMLDPEQSATLLDTASRNIDRLSVLINDLLDFEKLESSGIEYKKEKINIKKLISVVMEQTYPMSEQSNIQLNEEIGDECNLFADSQRLSQILVNLVSNAIKFSPENEVVEIGCLFENNEIKIYIKDNGSGIDEEFKEKIFERFTQADSADNRQVQRGTGLGLAISKRMTEGMGGRIGFDSIKGQGSTFFIIFPSGN